MMTVFRRAREERPVTAGCLFLSGLLFAGVSLHELSGLSFSQALDAWGALSQFPLWDGQWWRILLTAFHHGGLLHLLCNSAAIWYFGGLLEPRLGSLGYALLVTSAIAVTGVSEALVERYVGLSGLAYALFGVLCVLRRVDLEVAAAFDNQMFWSGIVWLFACVPLTYFQILPVGNIAHFSGIAYGWLAGQVLYGTYRSTLLQRLFAASHLLLAPAFYFAVHPIWSGQYHWRMADMAGERGDEDLVLRESQLAVKWNPALAGPWYKIAVIQGRRGELLRAWHTILQGISYNPAYPEGIALARNLWMNLPTVAERDAARKILQEVFKTEAPKWDDVLIAQVDVDGSETAPRGLGIPSGPLLPDFAPLPMRALDEAPKKSGRLPAPDPDQAGSAEEGRTT